MPKKSGKSVEVVRIGMDGTVTIYNMDPDGSVHPVVATHPDGTVVKSFPMIARNLNSLLKDALQITVVRKPRKKPKKK